MCCVSGAATKLAMASTVKMYTCTRPQHLVSEQVGRRGVTDTDICAEGMGMPVLDTLLVPGGQCRGSIIFFMGVEVLEIEPRDILPLNNIPSSFNFLFFYFLKI